MSRIKDLLVDKLDMPFELFNDEVKLTVYGKNRVIIERHKGIAVYRSDEMKISVNGGIVKICGRDMVIKNYGKDDIIVDGVINAVSFEEV